MFVSKIRGLGYFDRVTIDGYSMPMYNNKGIEIKDNEKLAEAIDNNTQAYNQGIGKLKINIYGEVLPELSSDEDEKRMEETRTELGLIPIKLSDRTRYSIGYAEILILKSDCSFPKSVNNRGKTVEDIYKLAKCDDELLLMTKALDIQKAIIKEKNGIDDCNIAIVDRVYITQEFRRCGISKWLHSNIDDITKIYGMIDIAAVLLIPGDFSNESNTKFGLSKDEYRKMLVKHYKILGYKFIDSDIMCKKLTKANIYNIIHKI